MNWFLAVLAPAAATVLMVIEGPAAVQIGYHALCAWAIWKNWDKIRPLLAWTADSGQWSLVLSIVIVSGMVVFARIWDPRVLRLPLTGILFPRGYEPAKFVVIGVFTMLIHTPLEELYWRGAALDEASPRAAVWGSVFFFYWLHAGPLYFMMGTRGLWLSLPTTFAGGVWALSRLKTKSLWPALISHLAAEVAILCGVLRYLRP